LIHFVVETSYNVYYHEPSKSFPIASITMDPFSITVGCVGLVQAIVGVSGTISSFSKNVRQARRDMDEVSRELTSLKSILELLIADDENESVSFPDTLTQHVSAIVRNCHPSVLDIEKCLTRHQEASLRKGISWAASGREEVVKLLRSVEAHKLALSLGLDMLEL
jgi:Fungal N-terminal domain of STAND proteins